MSKKLSLIVVVFVLTVFSNSFYAQGVKGIVIDEENKPLEFVSVALLQPADSLLVKYTSTGPDGKFDISNVKAGRYLFQVYLMTYQADQRFIDIADETIDFGSITLKREVNQLDEVTITAVVPIKIKQDTMAFNAKAFKVKQDDNVEDLIKKLPGVEIATDGKVSAQGEDVTKILVDGKEFFNNDQSIALKNLTADAIKSVEIIDEESDEARTTGVKDGEKSKIINLVLKEGKKSGYFGKMGAGYGTEDRYTTNLDINRFTAKTQLAVFGKLNNINNTGATVFRRDGSRSNSNSGFLTTGTAGANYNYEFKKDLNFNIDYHYGYSDREVDESSKRTEFTNNRTFSTNSESNSQNISNNHNINFSLRDRSKDGAYLEFRGNFKKDNRESDSGNDRVFFNEANEEDASSSRKTNSEDDRSNGGLNFSYNKKLNEIGRNLRARAGFSFSDNDDINYQQSLNIYNISDPQRYRESDEVTTRHEINKGFNYYANFRYMEPIVPHHFISFSTSLRNELNDESLDQTRTINDVLQNPFMYDIDYTKEVYDNAIGYVYSKDNFQFYTSGSLETMVQKLDLDGGQVINEKYNTFLPRATANYEFSKGKRLRLRYNRETRLPSAGQVSPVVNDFNPLFIRTGNTELTPEESDNFNIFLMSHDFKKSNSLFSFLNYSKTTNAFVTTNSIDENYVRYSSYINHGSKSNLTGMIGLGRKINGLSLRYNVRLRVGVNEYTTMINEALNDTKTNTRRVSFSLSNDNKNVVDVTVGVNFDFDETSYSLQSQDRDFKRQNYYSKIDWDLTNDLSFNSQFDYSVYTDNNFDSQNVPIWNMALEYAFLQAKRGNLKFQVFDILDKDVGIVRTSTENYFQETIRTNLGTYAMLSFTYNIKPPTGKSSKRDSGDRRRWRSHGSSRGHSIM